LLTLIVDDLDSHVAGFKERGISFKPVEEDSQIYRRVVVADLEGNRFQYTELKNKDNQA
jgi:hypothetical protein